MGIAVLPPNVNVSELDFTPEIKGDSSAIRFGLGAVKNVGASAVEAIVKGRKEGGPFTSIFEFCERIDMASCNRRVIESLIKCGAMDGLEGSRSQLMAVLDGAIEGGQRAARDRESGQSGLFGDFFGGGDGDTAQEHPLPNVPDWTDKEKLAGEKELLGFYVTGHPLDAYMDKVSELATYSTENIAEQELEKGTEVKMCGILTGHPAPPQQGRQTVGVDAVGRSHRHHRGDGLFHAV